MERLTPAQLADLVADDLASASMSKKAVPPHVASRCVKIIQARINRGNLRATVRVPPWVTARAGETASRNGATYTVNDNGIVPLKVTRIGGVPGDTVTVMEINDDTLHVRLRKAKQ